MKLSTIIIFAFQVYLSNSLILCPRGQIYNKCGSRCPPTCELPTPPACTKECVPGCYCAEGTLKDNTGKCVPSERCLLRDDTIDTEITIDCPPDEVFTTCGSGCPKTCHNRFPICIDQCVPRCVCSSGKIRDKISGKCIPITDCSICKQGEEYRDCGTACQPTCDNPNPRCTKQCKSGCFCPKGQLRVTRTGRCVSPRSCQNSVTREERKCRAGELFQECGTACPPTCDNPNPICTEECKPGCFCPDGQLRDKTGRCVLPRNCPRRQEDECRAEEIFQECGTACPPTCNNPNPEICTLQCVKGCFCAEGLIRNTRTGRCIPTERCSEKSLPIETQSIKCRAGEIFKQCGTACPPTCQNPNPEVCTAQCVTGCFCVDGNLRDRNGNCVTRSECSVTDNDCPDDEIFTPCLPVSCPPSRFCPQVCRSGCICPEGKVRDGTGKCVSRIQPIRDCPDGEIWSNCGKTCSPTCLKPNPTFCPTICIPGCVCQGGTIRDEISNKCVRPELC